MRHRKKIPREIVAAVVARCRRRCCICYGLQTDKSEKKGQIAHLDHESSNNALDNLVFLCLEHHDQYDTSTSQSKGLTAEELRRYHAELLAFVERNFPPSDAPIAAAPTAALDRPAYRTPSRRENSLQRSRSPADEDVVYHVPRSFADQLADREREEKAEKFPLVQDDRGIREYSRREVDALTTNQRAKLFAADPEMEAWWRGKSPASGTWPLFRVKGGIWLAKQQISQTPAEHHSALFEGIPALFDWYLKDRES